MSSWRRFSRRFPSQVRTEAPLSTRPSTPLPGPSCSTPPRPGCISSWSTTVFGLFPFRSPAPAPAAVSPRRSSTPRGVWAISAWRTSPLPQNGFSTLRGWATCRRTTPPLKRPLSTSTRSEWCCAAACASRASSTCASPPRFRALRCWLTTCCTPIPRAG